MKYKFCAILNGVGREDVAIYSTFSCILSGVKENLAEAITSPGYPRSPSLEVSEKTIASSTT